jgi:hypothetical protein
MRERNNKENFDIGKSREMISVHGVESHILLLEQDV